MNTVIFSVYDSGCCSSALLLRDDVDWGLIDRNMYKEQIPYANDIIDYEARRDSLCWNHGAQERRLWNG